MSVDRENRTPFDAVAVVTVPDGDLTCRREIFVLTTEDGAYWIAVGPDERTIEEGGGVMSHLAPGQTVTVTGTVPGGILVRIPRQKHGFDANLPAYPLPLPLVPGELLNPDH